MEECSHKLAGPKVVRSIPDACVVQCRAETEFLISMSIK